MRSVLVGVLFASVASAQPAPTAPTVVKDASDPIPTSTVYAQVGLQLGSESSYAFASARFDAGYHLGHTPAWIHVGSALGGPLSFNLGGDIGDKHYVSGSLRELSAGIEGRMCHSQWLCGALGVDVGYERVVYDDQDVTIPSQSVHIHDGSVIVTPRLQLDFGVKYVRVRPSLSLPFGGSSPAMHVTLVAIALQL